MKTKQTRSLNQPSASPLESRCQMKTLYYIGIDENGNKEIFGSDNPKDATVEASGYGEVWGPFDSKEEAENNL